MKRSERDLAIEAAATTIMGFARSGIGLTRGMFDELDAALAMPIMPPTPASTPRPSFICHAWNKICASRGMKAVRMPLSPARRAKFASCIRTSNATEAEWTAALMACAKDKHWQGVNDRRWIGSIDSFLTHREKWLDAGASPEVKAEGIPPSGYGTWDAYFSHMASSDGISYEMAEQKYGG